jgi:energy-coupling factor transporter ATP-binding protein EcfA2
MARAWRDPHVHGTLVSVRGQGILLTGRSGSGKSDLALALLAAGHMLIADDVVRIIGRRGYCPTRLEGVLHVRGVGIIDVRRHFGATAWLSEHDIDATVAMPFVQIRSDGGLCRRRTRNIPLLVETVRCMVQNGSCVESRIFGEHDRLVAPDNAIGPSEYASKA